MNYSTLFKYILRSICVSIAIVILSLIFTNNFNEYKQRFNEIQDLAAEDWARSIEPIEVSSYRNTTAQVMQRHYMRLLCSQRSDHMTHLPAPHNFLVNHEHKLLFCWNHKVASSTWIVFFCGLINRTAKKPIDREIPHISAKSSKQLEELLSSTYRKLIVVRNPFRRLVSAFRDRFQDDSILTQAAEFSVPRIFALTRPNLERSDIFNNDTEPKLKIVPTFQEFVQWLLVTPSRTFDLHWRLYSDQCGFCNIYYDIVIKLENFSEVDEASFLKDMGINASHTGLLHHHMSIGGITDFQVACEYFKQLTIQQATDLYMVYKKDFDMYQYSADSYINCAQNENEATGSSESTQNKAR